MKLIIDIPRERYEWIKEHKGVTDYQTTQMLYKRVRESDEQRTGHWIIISTTDMCCSECNEIEHLDTSRGFCSYCGTRMSENPTGLESEEQA